MIWRFVSDVVHIAQIITHIAKAAITSWISRLELLPVEGISAGSAAQQSMDVTIIVLIVPRKKDI